jgi:hypothetical protein
VVLFEMLTGQRLFSGDEVSDTLASILKDEPDWTQLPVDTPRRLSDLLHRYGDRSAASPDSVVVVFNFFDELRRLTAKGGE